jgi:hypothetical protein
MVRFAQVLADSQAGPTLYEIAGQGMELTADTVSCTSPQSVASTSNLDGTEAHKACMFSANL